MDNMYMEKRPREGVFGIYYVKLKVREFSLGMRMYGLS